MSKHPQNRFPRLRIVGPTDKKQPPAGLLWGGPHRPCGLNARQAAPTTQTSSHPIRMAVMPTLSRNLLFAAIAWMWNFLCGYFPPAKAQQRGASVLSFRRQGGLAPGFRRAVAQRGVASKKANGSVRWSSDCEVAPEGGRG
jgi:hypothetical protein